jgi:ankyrin repeat protein
MEVMRRAEEEGREKSYDFGPYSYYSGRSFIFREEEFTSAAKEGLKELVKKPWFTRVWIIQEARNATAAKIVCGTRSISARIFARALKDLDIDVSDHCRSVVEVLPKSTSNTWTRQGQKELRFKDLLIKFRHSEATDPRDQIYALLSIASDKHDLYFVRPDYNKCLGCVIYDTIAFLIGYHEHDIKIEPFEQYDLDQIVSNHTALSTEAVKWALQQENPGLLEKLPPRYIIRKNEFDRLDDTTIRILDTAIKTRNMSLFKALLDRYDPSTARSSGVSTPRRLPNIAMELAVDTDNADAVQELSDRFDEKEKSIQYWDQEIWRAIVWAMNTERPDLLKILLRRGEDWTHYYMDKVKSPYVLAAKLGDADLLDLVLNRLRWSSPCNNSIRVAFERRDEAMTRKLIECACSIDGNTFSNLLAWANDEQFTALRQLLLEKWSELFDSTWNAQIIKLIIENKADVNTKDVFLETLLMKATNYRNLEATRVLLETATNINEQNSSGKTALFIAVSAATRNRKSWTSDEDIAAFTSITGLLLSSGADSNIWDRDGRLPLCMAIEARSNNFTKLLLENRADPNKMTKEGKLPLETAIKAHSADLIKLLLTHGAEPQKMNKENKPPLQIAIQEGSIDLTLLLLEKGRTPDPKQYSIDLATSLPWSLRIPMLQLLFKYGADVNERNSKGYTQLLCALWDGDTKLALFLQESGADVDARDSAERTPYVRPRYKTYAPCQNEQTLKGTMSIVHLSGAYTPSI